MSEVAGVSSNTFLLPLLRAATHPRTLGHTGTRAVTVGYEDDNLGKVDSDPLL
jgi:hypothetical protein